MEDHPGGDEVLLAATGKSSSFELMRANNVGDRFMLKMVAGKDATDDFEDVGHSDDARDMMNKYLIGNVDKATVPKKRQYVAPADRTYNPDKTQDFIVKILQFLVPLVILGLAFAVRSYTKEKSA